MKKVFNAQTESGFSTEVPWSGGKGVAAAEGGLGGGTLHVRTRVRGESTWLSTGVTVAANSIAEFQVGSGMEVALELAGATGASLTAWIGGSDLN